MGDSTYVAITPGDASPLTGRQILRIAALFVLALGVMLLVRTAMKPPDVRKAVGLTMLTMFIGVNGIPLLLSLKLPGTSPMLRGTAALAALMDGLIILMMCVYALLHIRGEWSRSTAIGVPATIGGALICALALLLRAAPLQVPPANGAHHDAA